MTLAGVAPHRRHPDLHHPLPRRPLPRPARHHPAAVARPGAAPGRRALPGRRPGVLRPAAPRRLYHETADVRARAGRRPTGSGRPRAPSRCEAAPAASTASRRSATGWSSRTAAGCCRSGWPRRHRRPGRRRAAARRARSSATGARVTLDEVSEPRPGQRLRVRDGHRPRATAPTPSPSGADLLVIESTFLESDAELAPSVRAPDGPPGRPGRGRVGRTPAGAHPLLPAATPTWRGSPPRRARSSGTSWWPRTSTGSTCPRAADRSAEEGDDVREEQVRVPANSGAAAPEKRPVSRRAPGSTANEAIEGARRVERVRRVGRHHGDGYVECGELVVGDAPQGLTGQQVGHVGRRGRGPPWIAACRRPQQHESVDERAVLPRRSHRPRRPTRVGACRGPAP